MYKYGKTTQDVGRSTLFLNCYWSQSPSCSHCSQTNCFDILLST